MIRALEEWNVRRSVALVAPWTLPIVIAIAGHALNGMNASPDRVMPSAHVYGQAFALWAVWVPVTPVIVWLYRRWSSDRRTRLRFVCAHLALLALLYIAQSWLSLRIGYLTGHVPKDIAFPAQLSNGLGDLFILDLFSYVAVLAVVASVDYARRYQVRDLHASILETQLERARLEALQMQLHPHFLFNGLNAIAALVRRERNAEAVEVIAGFGELLRYVLRESTTKDVPLRDEIEFVHRYLELERVRFGRRLEFTMDVERDIEHAIVPSFILQPLVENALKHGISARRAGGAVRLSVKRQGRHIKVEVRNDGPPLPAHFSIAGSDGVGLRNLRDRVTTLFGDDGAVTIGNVDGGVAASMRIPFRTPRVQPVSVA